MIKFDMIKSEAEKSEGMRLSANARKELLQTARQVAIGVAKNREDNCCWADLVKEEMQSRGLQPRNLGNAAGSLFKTNSWTFTGKRIKSTQVQGHANEQKVWSLKV